MKSLTIALGLITSFATFSAPLSFEECSKLFLNGKTLESFKLPEQEEESKTLNPFIDKLMSEKSCERLLKTALLKGNGLLENRNKIGSVILETFVDFHSQWLMPKDLDQPKRCADSYHRDIYDFKTPAYHMTRAFFQRDRKVSMAVTSYSDLRSIRVGSNPTLSPETGMSEEFYEKQFGIEEEFSLTGSEDLIGFLYKKPLSMTKFSREKLNQTNDSFNKTLGEGKISLYQHLGAGFLGSPAFLLHYIPQKAFDVPLYQTNGKEDLPRKLAKGIYENLLCTDLISFEHEKIIVKPGESYPFSWKHPITRESKCLGCHEPLDNLASGLRNITFVKSGENCTKEEPQILIPQALNTSYTLNFWQELEQEEIEKKRNFSFSYPVGNLKFQNESKRFVGIRQLGQRISEDPRFYRCQVKKYHLFLFGIEPSTSQWENWSKEFQEHQDSMKLFLTLLNQGGRS